jgi:arylsulfatase
MRGQKGTPFIGGTRASSFWRWPGTLQPADCTALSAHIDFFPTIAAIAGATLTDKAKTQIEGRSLVPLLEKPDAPWPARTLFTHVGRWLKDVPPDKGKYVNCSVRTPEWNLVSISKKNQPEWMLFDMKNDPGENTDVAAQHGEVVSQMGAKFEEWWKSVVPMMVNEKTPLAAENPFWALYKKQFGKMPEGISEKAGKD